MYEPIRTITSSEFWSAYRFHRASYWDRKLGDDGELFIRALIDPGASKRLSHQEKMEIFKLNIDTVNLELSSFCNRQCIYCPLSESPRDYRQFINRRALEAILSDLRAIDYDHNITLNLYNEPFADRSFFIEMVALIRQRLPNVVIWANSNGDYLTPEVLECAAAAGLNKLKVTIHPPRGKGFNAEREHRSLKMFLAKLGISSRANLCHGEEKEFCARMGNLYLVIQSVDWQMEGNFRGGAASNVGNTIAFRNYPCSKPFREFTIFHDLAVTQCCDAFYDPIQWTKNQLFYVSDFESIFDAYCSPVLAEIRRSLFGHDVKRGICQNCSVPDYSMDEPPRRRDLREEIARSLG